MCVDVWLCVSKREREAEREREVVREWKRMTHVAPQTNAFSDSDEQNQIQGLNEISLET